MMGTRVLPKFLGHLLLAAALVVPACDGPGPTTITLAGIHGQEGQSLVRFSRENGSCLAVHRIDGTIHERYLSTAVTADSPQYLLSTGNGPGRDQGKILVFEEDGSLLVDYKATCRIQRRDGSVFQQATWPEPNSVEALRYAGRRLILFTTRGMWGLSSLVVLEALQPDQLVERMVFWSSGTISFLILEPPHVLAVCVSNNLKSERDPVYPTALAVFHLDDILHADPVDAFLGAQAPRKDTPPVVEGSPYRAFYLFPTDGSGSPYWAAPEHGDGEIIGTSGQGLRHRVNLATGEYEPEPNPAYRAAYEERRETDPDLRESIDEHMAALKRQLRVWRRAE